MSDPAELEPLTDPTVPTGLVLRLEAMRGIVDQAATQQVKSPKKSETAAEKAVREQLESLGYTE